CVGALVGTGAIAAGVALWALAAEGHILDASARAVEPYTSPNHLGLLLGRAGAAAFALAAFGPATLRWLAGAGYIATALGLLRTLSSGAGLGIAAASLVLSGLRGRR